MPVGNDLPSNKKIFVLDDDPLNVRVMERFLARMGHVCVSAYDPLQALALIDDTFDLLIVDVMMPQMDGFTFTGLVRSKPELNDIPILMATTLADKDSRLKAVQAGANDYLAKPLDHAEFEIRVTGLLRLKASRDEVRDYMATLNQTVADRTRELREALAKLQKASGEVVRRLATAAEFKDDDTANHIQRMSRYAALLAARRGLSDAQVRLVLEASPMHDIGKIGIPDAILLKPGRLTPDEWRIMMRHVEYGAEILGNSEWELLQAARTIALAHHEKWDGSGYPAGQSGEDIPLFGRICAVADVFDALTSRRPYKEPFTLERSLEIMLQGRGSHFDPVLLDLFLEDLGPIQAIMEEHGD